MADNLLGITNSLFGVAPTQQSDMEYALKNFRGMTSADIGGAQLYAAGKGLGRGLMQAAGVEDPEMAAANKLKAAAAQVQQQGLDPKTSAGMKAIADIIQQSGDTATAMKAMVVANQLEQNELAMGKTKAETSKITTALAQEEQLRKELQALGPNASQADIMAVVSKYGSPDKILATLQASQDRQDRLAFQREALAAKRAGEGDGGVGPVGKSGAYRNIYGEIIPASEMTKQRIGFQKAEQLLDNLNQITLKDIKNSESVFDWTSGENKKQIGGIVSKETVSAQSKINAAQLLKQIESLPPGSASNADMQAAKSSFPGYGNAANLERWVRETKQQLADSLSRQSEQYGFRQKIEARDFSTSTGSKPGSSRDNPIKLD